jgi:hypothetical protein
MKAHRLLTSLCLSVLCLAVASPVFGLVNRVFVSARSGNDANSCGNILTPCQTFAGAVLQLNPGGEAIVLDSGGYGPVTITQSLIIEAPPGVVAFIHPPTGDAVIVNAAGATVVLRGLSMDGAGAGTNNGINVQAVSVLHVENCVITQFAGGNGIFFGSAGQLFVKDTIIRGIGGPGIWVAPSSGTAQASVDRCRLDQSSFGLVSDNEFGGTAKATIKDSVASGASNQGLFATSGGELNAEGCLVANNNYGLAAPGGGSTLRASNCTVTDNVVGLDFSGGGSLLSRSNNTVEGNGTDGSFSGTYSAK